MIVLAVCLSVLPSAEARQIKIKFSHVVAVDTPKGRAAEFLKKELEEKSGGRFAVTIYPNSQLYRDTDAVSALLMGGVQLICPSTAKLTTLVPEFQVVDLPFLFTSYDDVHRAFDGRFGQMLGNLLKKKSIVPLAYWDNGFKQISNSGRPIKTPAQLEGKKIRIMSSKVLEDQFRQVGANPQVMAFSEVYTALEQGVIDGQENTWSNTYSQKFHEVQGFITETNHGYLGYALLTSKQFYNSLPPDLRKIFDDAVKRATRFERELARKINRRDRQTIIESGKTTVITLSEKQRSLWKSAFAPLLKKYPAWQELIDAAQGR